MFMSDSLIINLTILPEEGLQLSFSKDGAWFQKCFAREELPEFSLENADAHCLITRSGSNIYIRGNLSVTITGECARCLKPAKFSSGGDFTYTLAPEKAETSREIELSAEDLEQDYYHGDFIDLTPIICEQILLQAPMKILCAGDCQGLCPSCGTNLNAGKCDCRVETVDERLAALKNFKVKKI